MSDPYTGEIRMFGGNYAPLNWGFCNGQILDIQAYDQLFSIIGTTYGGDGIQNFALPDFRGRIPVHLGTGPGLSTYGIGVKRGSESVTLTTQNIPAHNHRFNVSTLSASTNDPQDNVIGNTTYEIYKANPDPDQFASMHPSSIAPTGQSQSHTNMQPYLCVSFIICLYGIYPSRS